MAFFGGLIFFFGLLWGISFFAFQHYLAPHETKASVAADIMFVLVGISHFTKRDYVEGMLEGLTKHKRLLNYTSGVFEILLGTGMLFEQTRTVSAIGLLLLLIAVFPANIYVAKRKPDFYNISRL